MPDASNKGKSRASQPSERGVEAEAVKSNQAKYPRIREDITKVSDGLKLPIPPRSTSDHRAPKDSEYAEIRKAFVESIEELIKEVDEHKQYFPETYDELKLNKLWEYYRSLSMVFIKYQRQKKHPYYRFVQRSTSRKEAVAEIIEQSTTLAELLEQYRLQRKEVSLTKGQILIHLLSQELINLKDFSQ